MGKLGHSVRLAKLLLWQQYRAQGLRLLLTPVAFGLFFVGSNLAVAQSPDLLTGPSRRAAERALRLYFQNVEGTRGIVLALFLIQGPYVLSLFSAITGLRVGRQFTRKELDSGRFELLLATPNDTKDVFRALILVSIALTLVQVFVLALIGFGGSLLFLTTQGVTFTPQFSQLVYVAFLLPIPTALWSIVVTVVVSLFVEGSRIGDVENVISILGLAPPLAAFALVTLNPSVSILFTAFGTIGLSVLGTLAGSWAVERWFDVERALA